MLVHGSVTSALGEQTVTARHDSFYVEASIRIGHSCVVSALYRTLGDQLDQDLLDRLAAGILRDDALQRSARMLRRIRRIRRARSAGRVLCESPIRYQREPQQN